ncbi:MAG: acetate--CoA ligase family protein [Clostridia bacterium]|nr:acetate--CoA ligase family protein [Clostridia bacterium]
MSKIEAIKKMMYAKSIAVIGASNKKGSVGNELMQRLIDFGYKGKIYPINLNDKEIEGIPAFKNISEIKAEVDMAVLAVPSKAILGVIDECHSANISNIIIISAGFKEIGGEGVVLENEVVKKICKYKMNMIGPNCLGIINSKTKMNASFNPTNPNDGKIGFATQSGAIASGIINLLHKKSFGFRQVVSLGNQADIDFLDIIEFWEKDAGVEIIMLYIESIPNSERFREICTRVSKVKPIILLKSGRSEMGGRAIASHTGSLAGDDISVDALLKSSGVTRELYLRDFINTAQIFNNCKMPNGEKLAILTNAGGPGIISVDTANDYGIQLAKLTENTMTKLKAILPPQASAKNPVDIIASASLEQYTNSAEILLKSKEVDILLVIYLYITVKNDVALIENLEILKKKYPNKTILTVFETSKEFYQKFAEMNSTIPVYNYTVDAISSLKRMIDRKKFLEKGTQSPTRFDVDKKKVEAIIAETKQNNVKTLSTFQSLEVFNAYKIPLAKYNLANNFEDAKTIANQIGYPVVLKISSTKITHKTDIGGVITNIKNQKELQYKWQELFDKLEKNNLTKSINGVVVMQQIDGTQREFVAGVVKKENIGNLAMFGMGGIFIETLNEVAFRPCPLNLNDAEELITSTKAYKLMGNIRGYAKADTEKMKEILLKLSQLVEDFFEIIEIDVNPIMIDKSGEIFAVDARIIIK